MAIDDRPALETDRLLLRPFSLSDVDDVFRYLGDVDWEPDAPENPRKPTRRDAERYVARAVIASADTSPTFAIVLNSTVVGHIDLSIDSKSQVAELGYGLGRDYWGRGLAPEAGRAVQSNLVLSRISPRA
jgi:ribosomal-protein-alanine N-acetyltransferase